MKKRMFAVLLCMVLLLAWLPATTHAATEISTIALMGFKEPVAGKICENYLALTTGTQGVSFHGTDWFDKTADRFLQDNETFQTGHIYQVQIWMKAQNGYSFKCVNDATPNITATLDGRKMNVTKAYEYKAFAMVVLSYEFPAIGSSTEPTDSHTHVPSDWRTTQVYHYKVCTTCGDMLQEEDHTGGAATCVEKGKCTVCGYEYIDVNENHTPDTTKWIARTDMYHYHACKLCGAHCDVTDHKWSPQYHAVDAKNHAYQCADCKGYDTAKPHNPGPAATETTPQTCKDCGYIIAPAANHTHQLTPVAEVAPNCTEPGVRAYYTCSGCSARFTNASATEVIEESEDLTIPPQGHHISNGWGFDKQTHWRICVQCNAKMIETDMAHELQDGKCTSCEYDSAAPKETSPVETTPKPTQPQNTAKDKEGLPWWALLLIGLAAVGTGIGGGVLVMKLTKRKRSDMI